MPTIDRIGPYRLFFFSNEGDPREPVHIHVKRGSDIAKIWLIPNVELGSSVGFSSRELRDILKIVEERRDEYVRAWTEYFGD